MLCIGLVNNPFVFQDPIINICDLKEIHSEINLTVPDPILISDLHDGLEAVSFHMKMEYIVFLIMTCG